ncbi:hypothetical protein J7643_02320 [bacterium]|nr:hypothetical protein [bacterium]
MYEVWAPFTDSFTARDLATLQSLSHTGLKLVSIKLSPMSEAAGKHVPELALPRNCVLVLLIRDDAVLYPRGDTQLKPWDQLFAVVDERAEGELRDALTRLAS